MEKISVVTALYCSAPYVEEFYRRHCRSLEEIGVDYEFVFVNDGSPDDSEAVVRKLIAESPRVRLVSLSRNFGQYPAMFAGMEEAKGDLIYTADVDLEEPPENIVLAYRLLKEGTDVDVVFGVIKQRQGGLFRKQLGSLFYFILNRISQVPIPPNQGWQRIMTRRYVDAVLRYRESETLPAGLMAMVGFEQVPYPLEKAYKGSSTYTFRKRLRLALNSITSFSSVPLAMICLFGIGTTIVSFIVIGGIVIAKLTSYEFQAGWASLVASIWCVGGLILSSVGMVGLYVAKVFNQVKNRPLFIVKSVATSASARVVQAIGARNAPART